MRRQLTAVLVLGLSLLTVHAPLEARVHTDSRPVMGTLAELELVTSDASGSELSEASDAVYRELERIEGKFSSYREDSELSRLSRLGPGQRGAVDEETFRLLRLSEQLHRLSGGAFDPTVRPLVEMWGLREPWKEGARLPDPQVVRHVRERGTGFEAVQLWRRGGINFMRKRAPRNLGLGALAKGYAVDRAGALLAERGVGESYVSIGGDLKQRGCDTVLVRDPRGGLLAEISDVCDEAVASSSQAERGFFIGDTRYGHIIDPRIGWPVTHGAMAVTVVHPSAALADALSTAYFVMGQQETRSALERWERWARELEGLAERTGVRPGVVMLYREGDGTAVWVSAGLSDRVELNPGAEERVS